MSMKHLLTGDDLFAHILMLRTTERRLLMVMEGPTDCSVVDSHLDPDIAVTIPGHGKESVLRCADLVKQQGVSAVLGIVDTDLDTRLGVDRTTDCLVYVDAYDMDALIYFSGSTFKRVLHALTSPETRRKMPYRTTTARGLIADAALELSALRLVSIRRRLELKLDNFPMHEVLNAPALTVNTKRMIEIALKRSGRSDLNSNDVERWKNAELQSLNADRYGTRGHDLHETLAIAIHGTWGGRKHSSDRIADLFRAAFSCPDVMATDLHRKVVEWASPYGADPWKCPQCA